MISAVVLRLIPRRTPLKKLQMRIRSAQSRECSKSRRTSSLSYSSWKKKVPFLFWKNAWFHKLISQWKRKDRRALLSYSKRQKFRNWTAKMISTKRT